MTTDPRCGTYAGAVAHKAAKEPTCPACKQAAADYQRMWRFRTGKQIDPGRCPHCGSVFSDHQCMGPVLR